MSVRREALLVALAGVVVMTALTVGDPHSSPVFPPCLWRLATGWECPGCGAARAIHALLHGDVAIACRTNILVVFSLPWIAIEIVQRIRYDAPMITARLSPAAIRGIAGAAVVFAVGRNLL